MASPSINRPLTLIHFGDLHLWRFGLDGDWYPKRWLGLFNLALRRGRAFPAAVARALAERLAGEEADYLLFAGDLTTTALAAEFGAGRALLAPLFERWGDRLIAIPGNHDRYTPRAARERLFERLFLGHETASPFTRDLDDAWTLVGFDCSVPRLVSSTGRVDAVLLDALRRQLTAERARGRRLLVLGHYPILYPPGVKAARQHALSIPERKALAAALDESDARLFLHGHKHRRWLLQSGTTLHLNCGSAGQVGHTDDRRPGYLKIILNRTSAPLVEAFWLAGMEEDGPVWRRAAMIAQVLDRT